VLILADLLFNHSEHAKLIKTVQLTLKKSPNSKAYVFFTPYRPWLLEKDLAFFDLARDAGFTVVRTFEKVMDKVMFEEDPGVRSRSQIMNILLTCFRMNSCVGQCLVTSSVGLEYFNGIVQLQLRHLYNPCHGLRHVRHRASTGIVIALSASKRQGHASQR
jgi:hypothetical protein